MDALIVVVGFYCLCWWGCWWLCRWFWFGCGGFSVVVCHFVYVLVVLVLYGGCGVWVGYYCGWCLFLGAYCAGFCWFCEFVGFRVFGLCGAVSAAFWVGCWIVVSVWWVWYLGLCWFVWCLLGCFVWFVGTDLCGVCGC